MSEHEQGVDMVAHQTDEMLRKWRNIMEADILKFCECYHQAQCRECKNVALRHACEVIGELFAACPLAKYDWDCGNGDFCHVHESPETEVDCWMRYFEKYKEGK